MILGDYNVTGGILCQNFTYAECADPVVKVGVESIEIHPDWDVFGADVRKGDIALIRMEKVVQKTGTWNLLNSKLS